MDEKKEKSHNRLKYFMSKGDFPSWLFDGIDLEKELTKYPDVSYVRLFSSWLDTGPAIHERNTCHDVINNTSADYDNNLNRELQLATKLSMIAFSLPYIIPDIMKHVFQPNFRFDEFVSRMMADSGYIAAQHMSEVLQGEKDMVYTDTNSRTVGFYVRTPIHIKNKQGKPVYRIPDFKHKSDLVKKGYDIQGNMNSYILKHFYEEKPVNPNHPQYDCYVLFRGTSNDFNALPQYGVSMYNSQVFRRPDYDPIHKRYFPEGSNKVPLFYNYYVDLVNNIKKHVYHALEKLHALNGRRIIICGHSMGAAITITFSYICHYERPDLWEKCQFRLVGSPMCTNYAAVKTMEGWIKQSKQQYKCIEILNTDDMILVKRKLGGSKTISKSIAQGKTNFLEWLVKQPFFFQMLGETKDQIMDRILRILQVQPDKALSAFGIGVLKQQGRTYAADGRDGVRLGGRPTEMKRWNTKGLSKEYDKTLAVVQCERNIDWPSEYIGKSHFSYMDLNLNLLWSSLRAYEANLYKWYHQNGLKKRNRLRVVGIFPKIPEVMQKVRPILDNWHQES